MARLIPGPALDERFAVRVAVVIEAEVSGDGTGNGAVRLLDISTDGFRMSSSEPLAVGTPIRLELPSLARLAAMVVWQDGTFHGCRFETPLSLIQVREISCGDDWAGIA